MEEHDFNLLKALYLRKTETQTRRLFYEKPREEQEKRLQDFAKFWNINIASL